MRTNIYQDISIIFMSFLLTYWVVIQYSGLTTSNFNFFYSFLFGLTPLFAGIIAMFSSRIWGGYKSAVGKAVLLIGLGIFLWGFGELIWSYYNFFLSEPAPYPSIADLGFAPSIFFYGLGAIFLAKATGAKYGFRNKLVRYTTAIIALIVLAVGIYLSVEIARGGVLVPPGETPLKIVLDIAYPVGGFFALVIAVVISGLSFKYLGGKYKIDIMAILLGLGVMYVADTVFSYTTTVGTFYNGNFGDLLLTTGTFLLAFGVLGFCTKPKIDEKSG